MTLNKIWAKKKKHEKGKKIENKIWNVKKDFSSGVKKIIEGSYDEKKIFWKNND